MRTQFQTPFHSAPHLFSRPLTHSDVRALSFLWGRPRPIDRGTGNAKRRKNSGFFKTVYVQLIESLAPGVQLHTHTFDSTSQTISHGVPLRANRTVYRVSFIC